MHPNPSEKKKWLEKIITEIIYTMKYNTGYKISRFIKRTFLTAVVTVHKMMLDTRKYLLIFSLDR